MRTFRVALLLFVSILVLHVASLARSERKATQAQARGAVHLTLLSTTDTHGHIEPWDYYANKPANLGVAKIATLVKQERAKAPDALLCSIAATRSRARRSRITSRARTPRRPIRCALCVREHPVHRADVWRAVERRA
jgi:hypothetical protein